MDSAIEVPIKTKDLRYYDLRDFYGDLDILFEVVRISENMRRGVSYLQLDGTELCCFNAAIEALIEDGKLNIDYSVAVAEVGH